jgi:hypothetical protein
LKAAFAGFGKPETDKEAELRLLGRTVEEPENVAVEVRQPSEGYSVATSPVATSPLTASRTRPTSGLIPRPLLRREPVRQLSFRCPVSIAAELRKKAAFNQLEQQEIIIEGIQRVLAELENPPAGWEE